MLSSDFEKEVQQKFGELKFTPPAAVWDNIEASLPAKNRRRLVFFWLLLGLLAGGGIWYSFQSGNQQSNKNAPAAVAVKSQEKEAGIIVKQPSKNETSKTTNQDKTAAVTPRDAEGIASTAPAINKSNTRTPGSATPGISTTINTKIPGGNGDMKKKAVEEPIVNMAIKDKTVYAKTNNDSKPLISGGLLEATGKEDAKNIVNESNLESLKLPRAETETAAVMNAGKIANEINDNSKPPATWEKPMPGNVIPQEDKAAILPIAGDKAATSLIKKNTQPGWEFGLNAGGGVSNVKLGLFEKSMYASDPQASNGSSGGGAAYGTTQDPTPGFAYAAGFYAGKAFSKRWGFYTGLQYQYASNNIMVGSKVDSAISLDFSTDKLVSSAFYRGGASTSYTNKYHLLQVPVLVNYKPVTGWPLFLEAGGSAAWLAGSNGLQYNAASNAYISSMDAFNRWLVSGSLGAGIRLAQKTNHPVNLGYRFSYTATSLTKEAFGKQHLTSSMLYLDIRLNK
jgi:hypothetical protein